MLKAIPREYKKALPKHEEFFISSPPPFPRCEMNLLRKNPFEKEVRFAEIRASFFKNTLITNCKLGQNP